MALNNQTALLKVVDNIVYFTIGIDVSEGSEFVSRFYTYETEVHTVPIGFVMSMTAYVNDSDVITLNIRPTISRQIGTAIDPNPLLAEQDIINEIPVIQVREMESILTVNDGETAVLGGLMQNELEKISSGVPFISGIPGVGSLFSLKEDKFQKSELVIFIKPSVIKTASLEKDLKSFKQFLPSDTNPNQQLPPVNRHWQNLIDSRQENSVTNPSSELEP